MTSTWKEAWEFENTAENAIGLDERTMQNMCTTWPPWMELSLGMHAEEDGPAEHVFWYTRGKLTCIGSA